MKQQIFAALICAAIFTNCQQDGLPAMVEYWYCPMQGDSIQGWTAGSKLAREKCYFDGTQFTHVLLPSEVDTFITSHPAACRVFKGDQRTVRHLVRCEVP